MAGVGRGVREIRVHVAGEVRVFYPHDLVGRPRAWPAAISIDDARKADVMTKSRRAASVIETTGSAFFDLFEPAEAERLSIQSGLALALEREIVTQKWTQAEAARRIGITQPRVSDLLRGRLDKFSIDALIVYLVRVGVQVRIDTSTPKRRRRAA